MGVCVCGRARARACVCVCVCVRVGADSVKHLLQLCGFENSLLFCGAVFLTLKPILVRFMNQHAGLFSIQLQVVFCAVRERERPRKTIGSWVATVLPSLVFGALVLP